MRIKQILKERGEEDTPIDEAEKRKIKVSKKVQTIFEIPLPTKDPELVEEVIKVLIGHIESKMNTKIHGLSSLKGQPKIIESYEELNQRLQAWYNENETHEGSSESSSKKPKVNMMKVGSRTKEPEKLKQEVENITQEIEDRGKALKQRKDQQIWFLDEEQGSILKLHQKLDKEWPKNRDQYYEEKSKTLEKEVELLWKKIRVYEQYREEERKN
jgi:hypothetical protein